MEVIGLAWWPKEWGTEVEGGSIEPDLSQGGSNDENTGSCINAFLSRIDSSPCSIGIANSKMSVDWTLYNWPQTNIFPALPKEDLETGMSEMLSWEASRLTLQFQRTESGMECTKTREAWEMVHWVWTWGWEFVSPKSWHSCTLACKPSAVRRTREKDLWGTLTASLTPWLIRDSVSKK